MIIVHGFVPVRAGHTAVAAQLFSEIARHARASAGCLRYEVFQSVDSATLFLLQEWASMEALALHHREPPVAQLIGDLPDLLDGDISTRRFEVGDDTTPEASPRATRPRRVLH